ncbi:hypothetical protein GCM10011591_36180 [Nocardia camponoti]|uniref:Type II secretion system protein GspF domain-containing protein n=1 Tax=Nocardia camponoti TaxID=1616106 RepID=A0A917VBU1_9NOCA|nr:hypothetical protein GCM10011591_36180 [Nocardia camponoti]
MVFGLICAAVAALLLPVSVARRRFIKIFRPSGQSAAVGVRPLAVGGGLAVLVTALVLGIGTGIAAVVLGATVLVRHRRGRADRERKRACGQLMTGLDVVVGELRVGAHPSAAAEVAAREADGDAAHALAVSAARSRLGGSGADGIELPDSVVSEELSRIAAAWRVAERHGLALAELLSAARIDLLGRIRFRDRTEAALAGPRASATVLAILPLIGIGLGQLMGAAPLAVLFASGAGQLLLPIGATLACCGLLWTDVITRRVTA